MKLRIPSLTVGFLLLFSAAPMAGAAKPPLRHRSIQEATNVYSLQIEHRSEGGTETLAGNVMVSGRPGPSNVITLTLRGTLAAKREAPSRSSGLNPVMLHGSYPRWSSSVMLADVELQFDQRGQMLRAAGDYPLPIPLGSVGQILVELLPLKSESRWEVAENLAVVDEPADVGPGMLFSTVPTAYSSYSSYSSSYGQRGAAVVAVARKLRYEIKSSSPEQVTVTKRVSLDSALLSGHEPHISAAGEGEFVFEPGTGRVSSSRLDCKAVFNTESVTRRTATSVQLKLLTGAELEKALQPAPPRVTAYQPPKKLTREEVGKLLEDMKSSDNTARLNAASKLQNSELAEVPPELIEFMTARLSDTDTTLKYTAARIIADYGTTNDVPALLKLLKSEDSSQRSAAIRGLGRLKEKSAAEPIAAMLADGGYDAHQAVAALTKIGPAAEDAVLPLLQERHIETRRQACNVLKQIGTKKSLDPLRELMLSKDRTLSEFASEAVRSIVARLPQ